jgi:hypothetical protein
MFMVFYVSFHNHENSLFRPLEAFQHYLIENSLERLKILENPHKLPWSTFIGVLGMPGKFFGVVLLLLDNHVLHLI